MSTHINAANVGEIAETVLLPGDPLRAKFMAENYLENARCYNTVRNMLGYTGTYKGFPVSIQGTGMGMPSMGIYSWELITSYGCKNLLRIGTAGSFHSDIHIGDIVVALATSTDSNYSHTFGLPGQYSPSCSEKLVRKLIHVSDDTGIDVHLGNVLSSDVFYELDDSWWKHWRRMNVMAVEMEAAALYMNAAHHGVDAMAMMTISDHFVTGEKMPTEVREKKLTDMFKLSLETVIREF